MAFSDWYEIKDHQTAIGQPVLNVYHVQRENIGVNAVAISDAFQNIVLGNLLSLQDPSVVHTILEVASLSDPTDFFTVVPSPNLGTRAGDPLAQFNAASIQFNRTRTDMKNGQKRFSAGVEADIAGNEWFAPFMAELTTLADAMIATWFTAAAPAVPICDYGILKRVCTVQPPPSPCPSYRLPEDDAELQFYFPVTSVPRLTIRSQVSRKVL